MSQKERDRKVILEAVKTWKLTVKKAAARLGVCYRQICNLWKRYRERGDAGLGHRSRGRWSNRRMDEAGRASVLAQGRERSMGLWPTLTSEKLAQDGFLVDHETLRWWLLADGLWVRSRKRGPSRQRRAQRERFGVGTVGWQSPRLVGPRPAPRLCLMDLVGDATGCSLARMMSGERTDGALRVLWAWVTRYVIPRVLYADCHTMYRTDRDPTLEEQLAREGPLTVFGRGCQHVGIELIHAHSPHAKGRGEWKHAVSQDRLAKDIPLWGPTPLEAVNALLADGLCDNLTARFARPPANTEDATGLSWPIWISSRSSAGKRSGA